MKFDELPLKGAFLIRLETIDDSRGFFSRLFCENEFSMAGLKSIWVQINNSFTKKAGTLRGLHYQVPPKTETKVIRCTSGAIWDVIVDLRKDSSTYGKWFGVELSAQNRLMLYVPDGFAHGFLTLEDNSEVIYLVSEFYSSKCERGLLWNDGLVGINWPKKPILVSDKDLKNSTFDKIDPVNVSNA